MIVAFSGGVGGARMCAGLAQVYSPDELAIVVNTGDDFDHWGLRICPDLDTVMYTLSGQVNEVEGWGVDGESWTMLEAVRAQGGTDWFRLGDKDLATHLVRTHELMAGKMLSEITDELFRRRGVMHPVFPVTDDMHRSIVVTPNGPMAFQDYFVRHRAVPKLVEMRFQNEGDRRATPSEPLRKLMAREDIEAVIVCPSNPVLSILPILEVTGVQDWIMQRRFPVIAVTPFIGGAAVKGPAAKIFGELGIQPSFSGLSTWYGDLVDHWLLDAQDRPALDCIDTSSTSEVHAGMGIQYCDTLLNTHARRRQVAETLAAWIKMINSEKTGSRADDIPTPKGGSL